MPRFSALCVACMLTAPVVAAAMPTFPLTMDGRGDSGGSTLLRFTLVLDGNGTLSVFGFPGTWTYSPANDTLSLNVAGLVQTTGVRTGRCFDGQVTMFVPIGAGAWRALRASVMDAGPQGASFGEASTYS